MVKKILYTCSFCHTDYADKDRAIECEKNHKFLDSGVMIGIYKPIKSIPDGAPTRITMSFPGINKPISYVRE